MIRLATLAASLWIATASAADPVQQLVDALDPARFEDHIEALSSSTGPTGGTRHWNQPGNAAALDYVEAQLVSYGYSVERHGFLVLGVFPRDNLFATKTGSLHPESMYLVSAHIDSVNFDAPSGDVAPGADDDASGIALVLEAARVFAPPGVETEHSVRFVFWNNEESGLLGSQAYVDDRAALQGVEDPPGSGLYPEPSWLGIVQHDMLLYDHGLPPQAAQIPGADVDVEYQAASEEALPSLALANALLAANGSYAPDHPVEIGNDMQFTDSVPFQDHTAAVSVRENQRILELGAGSNPHQHSGSDVVASYSSDDFRLGFSAVQTTTAAMATLAGAQVAPGVPIPPPATPLLVLALGWAARRTLRKPGHGASQRYVPCRHTSSELRNRRMFPR